MVRLSSLLEAGKEVVDGLFGAHMLEEHLRRHQLGGYAVTLDTVDKTWCYHLTSVSHSVVECEGLNWGYLDNVAIWYLRKYPVLATVVLPGLRVGWWQLTLLCPQILEAYVAN